MHAPVCFPLSGIKVKHQVTYTATIYSLGNSLLIKIILPSHIRTYLRQIDAGETTDTFMELLQIWGRGLTIVYI